MARDKLPGRIEHPYNPTLPTQAELNAHGKFEANRRVQADFFLNLGKATSHASVSCYRAIVVSNGLTTKLDRWILDLALKVKQFGPCSE